MGRKKKENSTVPTSTGGEKHVHQPPEFGLHMGQVVNKYIVNDKDLSIDKVAKRMFSQKQTLANKFKVPYFGTVYDLLKLSIAVEHDFFAYPQMILRTKNIEANKVYTEGEYETLRKENEQLKNLLQLKIEENETLRTLNQYFKKDLSQKSEKSS
ncbi:MAG: hypothetical protein JNL70_06990 [Saprospiraceae bacterium]|nr:hypothetical protein [Saprospiraceae bacterium]